MSPRDPQFQIIPLDSHRTSSGEGQTPAPETLAKEKGGWGADEEEGPEEKVG